MEKYFALKEVVFDPKRLEQSLRILESADYVRPMDKRILEVIKKLKCEPVRLDIFLEKLLMLESEDEILEFLIRNI